EIPKITARLGELLVRMGRHAEGESLLRQAYRDARSIMGDNSPDTLTIQMDFANELRQRQAYAEADPLVRDALERSRKVFGEDHPQTVMAEELLAMLLAVQNRH